MDIEKEIRGLKKRLQITKEERSRIESSMETHPGPCANSKMLERIDSQIKEMSSELQFRLLAANSLYRNSRRSRPKAPAQASIVLN